MFDVRMHTDAVSKFLLPSRGEDAFVDMQHFNKAVLLATVGTEISQATLITCILLL